MKSFQEYLTANGEIGFVDAISHSIAYVSGLPGVHPHELVVFETGEIGYILSLRVEYVEVLLFVNRSIKAGTKVARTGEFLEVKVGEHLLGKTIDPFARSFHNEPLDSASAESRPVYRVPDGISYRKRIQRQFETGVSLVDLVLPLGKGQRELIIGDRKTGKTNFLLQTLLMQAQQGTVCIYVAIGKKQLSVKKVEEFIQANNISQNCLIVASLAHEASGVIYITPYTGMTIAEYFAGQGRDVLVIFDDLTTHARYYREISLLIKRFPGRNSYPGDIFFAHARLLERAGNFVRGDGEAAITCLAVAETAEGDLSGYIQTNLMSMTDGHLYFDSDLFAKGRRPAIHPFLSVTRVGRQTQTSMRQTLNREISSFLSLYDKMQNFTHFGAEVSETISSTLKSGERILSFFEQLSYTIVPVELQILLFSLAWIDVWRDKSIDVMKQDMKTIRQVYAEDEAFRVEIHATLEKSKSFNEFLGEIRGKPDEFYKKLRLSQ